MNDRVGLSVYINYVSETSTGRSLHLWLSLNFIYFTTITKQGIQLIVIMLVGTDVCVPMVFVCEETGVPGGNPPV